MPPKPNVEERLRNVKDIVTRLIHLLPTSTDPPVIAALAAEISKRSSLIPKLVTKRAVIPQKEIEKLDTIATELWNLCNRQLRRGPDAMSELDSPRTLLVSRALTFAFGLLGFTRWKAIEGSVGNEQRLAVVRLSLSTIRTCLDQLDYDGALEVLKETTDYTDQLNKMELSESQMLMLKKYEANYFILRTSLCAKQDRIDVANHMFEKGIPAFRSLDPAYAEHLAEILFDIGKTLMRREEKKLSVVWIKRSYDLITMHSFSNLSRVGIELRLAIIKGLVHAYIMASGIDYRKAADELVSTLENDIGDSPVTLLLRIKLLKSVEPKAFDVDAFADTLARFAQIPDLTESQFKTILYETKTLHQRQSARAILIITSMLNDIVLDSTKRDWVSKTLILLVFYHTTGKEVVQQPSLLEVVESIYAMIGEFTDTQTARAVQSILWKKIDGSITKGHTLDAESWCKVALHPLFTSAGVPNHGKIARKLIICALERQDYEMATSIYNDLPESIQKEQTTAFLMFKVATRNRDMELAASCLANVSCTSKEGRDILYACVLDAQNSGNFDGAISAMTVLMNINETLPGNEVHVPSLMRCIIRLLYRKLAVADEALVTAIANDICTVFESAAFSISKSPVDSKGHKLFPIEELDWFSQNSYNTGVKNIKVWDPHFTQRILTVCLDIMNYYPDEIPLEDAQDLALKKLCCHFIIATSLAAIARCENNVKEKLQAYLTLRKHVKAYDDEYLLRRDTFDPVDVGPDLNQKLAVLYVFDFEAACTQREWKDLSIIVAKSVDFCQETRLDVLKGMGDYLLSLVDIPAADLYQVLKLVINEIWKLEAFELDKLSQYLRCLFQAVIVSTDDLAQEVLGIFVNAIADAASKKMQLPTDEIEWMASSAFNHGIDYFCSGDDAESKAWCEKALELAQHQPDGGVFRNHLQERYDKLGLKDKECQPEVVTIE